jgi:nitric oxide dioxygenase
MTPAQLQLIEKTLPEINARDDLFAAEFYKQCFDLWPETRSMVRGDLTERGRALVAEFIALASCVSDMDTFVARAHEIGVRHRERGALREHYEIVEQALTAALAAVLEDEWDEPTAQAWHRLYCLMAETMLEGSAGIAFVCRKR